ncbi:DNA-directed RNA polymerase core subunit rpc40 [Dimargaris cristalligena]|uniref:DNA-directed RNA polymerases I and III subunit RPAC1 n=1 Tax=Dimargaris cristalligena TaxID=215637 RepID=A0A4P9ZT37_9FUNG|nr:DNA-directed RNA polymerase core subunit rpc40 [Dimargaris cristalligena]RKP36605.1 DNA-directed RNA polymerase [Dimargaris cristalligena]|eukprot:RKP36605.1 DNA-directed RNA polymerase [Dimargaris cristalligena]
MPYDRDHIVLEAETVTNISSHDYPHQFPGDDRGFGVEAFRNKFNVKVWRVSREEMEFDLVGLDASLSNAFRRILLADVPTMAIEKVFMHYNTGVVQDEVLSQRLGLIPINADPTKFVSKSADDPLTELNTIVFKLDVECTHNKEAAKDETDPNKLYKNSSVYSGHLKWVPQHGQAETFADRPIKPVLDDILLAKLRPGQRITCELHCEKSSGRDHAKYSPVATASYRLLPVIDIKQEITGDMALKLQKCFPSGVVDIIEKNGQKTAKVVNARKDTMSREVLRHKEFQGLVELKRKRDHFIFKIESTGAVPPAVLFAQSVKHMMDKCELVLKAVSELSVDTTA